jgi:GTP-binding protein
VDVQAGMTALDQSIAALLRRHGQAHRVVCVANKVDSDKWVADAQDASRLGFGETFAVSASNGFGVRQLLEALYDRLPPESEAVPEAPGEMKLAIVARRNAGKSTLINRLAGESRVIVSEIAGTTRDAVDVRFEIKGRTMIAIDTAGLRKQKSFADAVEMYAYDRAIAAIVRADVTVFMVDATTEVSQVDKKLSQELQRQYKPTVIAVNKWDLVEEKLKPADYLDYLTRQLRGLDYAPIVFVSAKTSEGLDDLVAMAFNLYKQANHWETTGKLNRVVESIIARRGPTPRLGTEAKVYYASQIGVRPPTFALVVNNPALFVGTYQRYLLNRLHEELSCSEVPIRLVFRKRKRMELSELKRRGKSAETL